jgi:hypothetical protein
MKMKKKRKRGCQRVDLLVMRMTAFFFKRRGYQ